MSSDLNNKTKILICESDFRLLARLKIWIKAMGMLPITCHDGIAAQRLYQEELPEIIILSQQVNHIGSLELIEYIKKIDSYQKIVVMLNEDVDAETFKKYIDLHVDRYLNKPIDAEQLFKTIDYLLNITYNKLSK